MGAVKLGQSNTRIIERSYEPADLYLYQTVISPTITANVTLDDIVITVNDTTGATNGDVITFYEGIRFFQSIVKSFTATTITIQSPIDFAYTTDALVDIGIWNMAVNGSSITQIFSIKSPQLASLNIHTINCTMLDSSDMDDGKFGGIAQLTNGIIFKLVDGIKKNLALVVNNLGFYEIGFSTAYSAKAPAGKYGFRARRYIPEINGVILKLSHADDAEFQVHIQDDLTDLDLVTFTVNGYKGDI